MEKKKSNDGATGNFKKNLTLWLQRLYWLRIDFLVTMISVDNHHSSKTPENLKMIPDSYNEKQHEVDWKASISL